ncbi:MAG: hypothetical protein WC223_11665 [Bacteroidales bacterium]|jgi:hypothetical protein
MKKNTSVLALALFAGAMFTFTSCKKDYSCECTISGQPVSTATFKATKKKAKTSCEALSDATMDIVCAIK